MFLSDSDYKKSSESPSSESKYKFDVFISHAKEDTAWCEKLVARLKKRYRLKVWFDQSQLQGGANLPDKIGKGLDASRRFVPVLSPAYIENEWTQAELNAAIQKNPDGRRGFILPILHKSCEIPSLLSFLKYIDFRRDSEFNENCRLLAEALRQPEIVLKKSGTPIKTPGMHGQPQPLDSTADVRQPDPEPPIKKTPVGKAPISSTLKRLFPVWLILFILLGGLLVGRHFVNAPAPSEIQSVHVILPPPIHELVQIDSLEALNEKLRLLNRNSHLQHYFKKQDQLNFECNDNCYEIFTAGGMVKYFTLVFAGRSFDLKSGQFLDDAAPPISALKKYHLLFVLPSLQTGSILSTQPEIQKALENLAGLQSGGKLKNRRH